MTKSQEIIMPIWKEYWHDDNLSSKELVVKIWDAAINAAADEVYNSKTTNKTYQLVKNLIVENDS